MLADGEREGRRSSLKYFDLERNYFPLECAMILILFTLIFPLAVLMPDFHTHCFQLVCGTMLPWLPLALSPFSPFLFFHSRNAWLSFNSQKSLLTFHSLNSSGSTLPRGSFTPPVSSWTRHSLWSFITNLSLYTFPSLGSVWPRDARHSRYTIWSWNTRETKYRSLKGNMICNLKQARRRNGTLNTRGNTPRDVWWRYAFRSSKSWPYFRPKKCHFYARLQTWPLYPIIDLASKILCHYYLD